jgi:hypothetical protein
MPTAHMTTMRRQQLALFCLLSCFLTGCAADQVNINPPAEPEPDYRTIIANNLRSSRLAPQKRADEPSSEFFDGTGNIFANPKKIGSVEIADSQRLELSNNGWAWMTCIRIQTGEPLGTFAIFISKGAIVDARRSISPDRCEEMIYRPLALQAHPEADHPKKRRRKKN